MLLSPRSKPIYVPGHESSCVAPTEAMHVYDKMEENELIEPFEFSQEKIHPGTSTNIPTTNPNFNKDYHQQLAQTFYGISLMPSNSYQDHIIISVLKEPRPSDADMECWFVLSDCILYILPFSPHYDRIIITALENMYYHKVYMSFVTAVMCLTLQFITSSGLSKEIIQMHIKMCPYS